MDGCVNIFLDKSPIQIQDAIIVLEDLSSMFYIISDRGRSVLGFEKIKKRHSVLDFEKVERN